MRRIHFWLLGWLSARCCVVWRFGPTIVTAWFAERAIANERNPLSARPQILKISITKSPQHGRTMSLALGVPAAPS
jgi:hypothetical protein